eukprot:CAMPEP_0114627096 /NCGR_PEP_ID=MMETSP0168-20121206/12122_1 /TAXON_ID=95228 ORGANISM="Vannella sp., Strain DIVA3 517/6/12" /NCGR_SAMPLE_ID=MMETSP0168 /ASSEMBLY_ACC=CAM_ASM_000044 /LENGTH=129 /DNA_ID=CAMNT_0001838423 /DNA_START=92 /DNA_END=478 /DNA_ORIENTATION=-
MSQGGIDNLLQQPCNLCFEPCGGWELASVVLGVDGDGLRALPVIHERHLESALAHESAGEQVHHERRANEAVHHSSPEVHSEAVVHHRTNHKRKTHLLQRHHPSCSQFASTHAEARELGLESLGEGDEL